MKKSANQAVHILRALANETRFRIMENLAAHDICVRGLSHRLGCSEAAVSQHLKILREAGLVRGEKRGYWTHYSVSRDGLRACIESVSALIQDN